MFFAGIGCFGGALSAPALALGNDVLAGVDEHGSATQGVSTPVVVSTRNVVTVLEFWSEHTATRGEYRIPLTVNEVHSVD
ncbi:hypothetical protein [Amycolatopsis anabasis]|uniref:hypothetical protein n=1 Tax=Amycolatopsis anabasis TaxID=1840409 RepID=UPI00131C3574|nr:hypothetical protein [Amycolatopsis anabasis]